MVTREKTGRPASLTDLELLAQNLPELVPVPGDTRTKFLAGATVLQVAPGDILLRQGDTDESAFFVLAGRIVVKREESGRLRSLRLNMDRHLPGNP